MICLLLAFMSIIESLHKKVLLWIAQFCYSSDSSEDIFWKQPFSHVMIYYYLSWAKKSIGCRRSFLRIMALDNSLITICGNENLLKKFAQGVADPPGWSVVAVDCWELTPKDKQNYKISKFLHRITYYDINLYCQYL